jgi:acetylglutamate kinase
VQGLRVTDAATVEIVEMVLSGSINKQIVTAINKAGGKAIGLSGKDANLIRAKHLTRKVKDPDSNIERVLDLGFVGEPEKIDPDILDTLYESDIIPVIAPIGVGENGETYNINADTVAGAIASAIEAKKLIILTDVAGLLDKDKNLISQLSPKEARKFIKNGTITGGMIPKMETCIEAVENGCEAAHILDGRVAHVLLVETFTEHGAGTMIWEGEIKG